MYLQAVARYLVALRRGVQEEVVEEEEYLPAPEMVRRVSEVLSDDASVEQLARLHNFEEALDFVKQHGVPAFRAHVRAVRNELEAAGVIEEEEAPLRVWAPLKGG